MVAVATAAPASRAGTVNARVAVRFNTGAFSVAVWWGPTKRQRGYVYTNAAGAPLRGRLDSDQPFEPDTWGPGRPVPENVVAAVAVKAYGERA